LVTFFRRLVLYPSNAKEEEAAKQGADERFKKWEEALAAAEQTAQEIREDLMQTRADTRAACKKLASAVRGLEDRVEAMQEKMEAGRGFL
jgi:uncharacterized coiled-coil protein SlyX